MREAALGNHSQKTDDFDINYTYLKIQKIFLGFLLLFRTREGRKRTLELTKRIFKNFYFFQNFDAKSIFQPGRILAIALQFFGENVIIQLFCLPDRCHKRDKTFYF